MSVEKSGNTVVICLDLEGVLVPEIWIAFAEKTGIEALTRTTRDEPNYDRLMQFRLSILKKNRLKLKDVQRVIGKLDPLPGAAEFLNKIRSQYQLIILSDTFYEFAGPLMKKLSLPTLFCHRLQVSSSGIITQHKLRQSDQKRKAVKALKNLNFEVRAAGDSYNDTTMLTAADRGILFKAPKNVISEFPQFISVTSYSGLYRELTK